MRTTRLLGVPSKSKGRPSASGATGSSRIVILSSMIFSPILPVMNERPSRNAFPPKPRNARNCNSVDVAAGSRMTVYAPGSTSAGSRPSSAFFTARSARAGTSSEASLRSTDSAKPDEFCAIAMTEQPACVDVAYARSPVDPAMKTSFAVVSM